MSAVVRASAVQAGEEYRQTLRKALAENRERIVAMAWKAGSGMAKGKDRGVLFCAAVGGRTYLRFMPVDDAWRPRGTEDAALSPPAHTVTQRYRNHCGGEAAL
jgi:hypothetical protein